MGADDRLESSTNRTAFTVIPPTISPDGPIDSSIGSQFFMASARSDRAVSLPPQPDLL